MAFDSQAGKSANFYDSSSFNFVTFRHPVSYVAYFVAGSDVEFTVSPAKGELLPVGTNGTLITIKFNPTKYGKIYHGKLGNFMLY